MAKTLRQALEQSGYETAENEGRNLITVVVRKSDDDGHFGEYEVNVRDGAMPPHSYEYYPTLEAVEELLRTSYQTGFSGIGPDEGWVAIGPDGEPVE